MRLYAFPSIHIGDYPIGLRPDCCQRCRRQWCLSVQPQSVGGRADCDGTVQRPEQHPGELRAGCPPRARRDGRACGAWCKLFGSTQNNQQTPWMYLPETATYIAAGFNLSNLACSSPNNCLAAASKTVFRPWEYLVNQPPYVGTAPNQYPDPYAPDPVSCNPVIVNPPFTPYPPRQ